MLRLKSVNSTDYFYDGTVRGLNGKHLFNRRRLMSGISTITCVFGSNVTPGNLIVLGMTASNGLSVVSSISDGNGSSFTAIDHMKSELIVLWTYYLPNSTGGVLG